MLGGVPQHGARHGGSALVEERGQPLPVVASSGTQPAAHGLLDQVLPVVEKHLGDAEGVGHIPCRMKYDVLTMAVRRSHRLGDRASS
jgi:hypothetical protein